VRLEGIARVTPVYGSETLSLLAGREIWLKAENLQRTGAFKVRGAVNKIATLAHGAHERRRRGERGQPRAGGRLGRARGGVARLHLRPADAPMAKVEACRNYGAETVMGGACSRTFAGAHAYVEETGATFIHLFEDEIVIAGQGRSGSSSSSRSRPQRPSSSRSAAAALRPGSARPAH
jgi:threonine dehydratase